jgi:hypothetical protein
MKRTGLDDFRSSPPPEDRITATDWFLAIVAAVIFIGFLMTEGKVLT